MQNDSSAEAEHMMAPFWVVTRLMALYQSDKVATIDNAQ